MNYPSLSGILSPKRTARSNEVGRAGLGEPWWGEAPAEPSWTVTEACKARPNRWLHRAVVVLPLAVLRVSAAVLVIDTPLHSIIPDDTGTGLAHQVTVSEIGLVNSVTVQLNVSAAAGSTAFLGDLYAYLQHDANLSILLNRPGRRLAETTGYDDNQSLSVTLSDNGIGDIHNYRTVLFGNDSTPLIGSLTGTWIPDGRTADPAAVLSSQAPTALLSRFSGASLEGNWRLFVADLSDGGVHQLDNWSLTINYTAVPEPAWLPVIAVSLVGWAGYRKWVRRRSQSIASSDSEVRVPGEP